MKNVSSLRAMYNLVEENVHNLSSLGVLSDTYGKLLVCLSIEKIPHSLRLAVSCEFDDKVWDLDNLFKYFQKKKFLQRNIVLC